MSCKKIKNLLVDYYENSLESEGKKLVEDHLRTCESCPRHLQEVESLFDLLAQEKTEKPEESFWIDFVPEVRGRIDEVSPPKSVWSLFPRLAPRLGLVIALLLVGVILFSNDYRFANRVAPEFQEETTYSLYDFENSEDQLAEILSSMEARDQTGGLISPDDEKTILALQETVEEQYWDKAGWDEILEDLSTEEVNLLEREIEKIEI